MDIKQLKRFLPYAMKTKVAVMVHGLHGIGKSQTIKQFAEEQGMQFIDRRLSQMESGDLLGLPSLENGRTSFFTPDWLPTDPNSKGILFLDEINRARRDVLQGVFQLVLDRQLGSYKLPDGWSVISAINPNTDDYDVTNVFDIVYLPDLNDTLFVSKDFYTSSDIFFKFTQTNILNDSIFDIEFNNIFQ